MNFPLFLTIFLAAKYSGAQESPDDYDEQEETSYKWIDDPEATLPFSVCKRNDPARDECIRQSIQDIIPYLQKGYEKLGIAPLDPYVVRRAVFDYKRNEISGHLNIKNAKTTGLAASEVKNVMSNITDTSMSIQVDVHFPKLVMEGNYRGEGHFNSYYVKSKGYFNITQRNVFISLKMGGEIVERGGEKYMQIHSFDFLQPIIGHMRIYASGLYPDPAMNQVVLDFMNAYWPFVYQQLLPETKKSWEPIMIDTVNQVFDRVPFRRLLLED